MSIETHDTLTFLPHAWHFVVTAGPRHDFLQSGTAGPRPQRGQIFAFILVE